MTVRVDDPDTPAVLFSGWLQKKHHQKKDFRGRTWAPRYLHICEVKGRIHMSHGPGKKPSTSISLSEISCVSRLGHGDADGHKYAFEIRASPLRLVLAGEDKETTALWMEHIERRCAFWREKTLLEGLPIAISSTGAKIRESGSNAPPDDTSGTAETGRRGTGWSVGER
ncbi:hypothetical protein AB1Y20_006398 [Prymnesium parvum]|uniref:PH domain-containing protein n=1 Tax=Prymnesium parvum TaxID=97485 RepID=A0AB34J505_PRYPA|mmetsp:Transcript_49965/g.124241  ORF Transcript_49965/g.124241 Transcript_49965/m.124241 type:complete len:169 (-) Transcript_49965:223-729(-)